MDIIIKPHSGIVINKQEINIGEHINAAKNVLKDYEQYEDMFYFENGNIAITVKGEQIYYIELRRDSDNLMKVYYKSTDLFTTTKNDVIILLTNENEGISCEEESGSVDFKKIGINIYNSLTEADIKEMIQEAKQDGMYEEMYDDIKKDIERANYIETIGIY